MGGWTWPRIALMRSGSDTDPAMGQYVGDVSRGRIEKPTTPWSLRAVPPERRYARGVRGPQMRGFRGGARPGGRGTGSGSTGTRPPANRGLPALPRAQDEAEDDGEGTPPADEQSKSKSRERHRPPRRPPAARSPSSRVWRLRWPVEERGGGFLRAAFCRYFCIWTRDFLCHTVR